MLEYYSGILFLTTNRVGVLDDAFRSRLHLTLYYPKLTKEQTVQIWKTNLERMETINQERERRQQPPIKFENKKIIKWVKKNWKVMQWNGRQIRNAFQTAIALADFKAKKAETEKKTPSSPTPPFINDGHFKLIAKASIQFSEYLRLTHGNDEDGTAARDQMRLTNFDSKVRFRDVSDSSDDDEDDASDSGSETRSEKDSDQESGAQSSKDSESESEVSEKDQKKKSKKKRSTKGLEGKSSSIKKETKGKKKR
jgi:hypothetical protein